MYLIKYECKKPAWEEQRAEMRAKFIANTFELAEKPFKMWRKGDVYYIRTYPENYREGTLYKFDGKQTFYKRADFYKENWKLL